MTCEGVLFTGLARLGSARCGLVRFGSVRLVVCGVLGVAGGCVVFACGVRFACGLGAFQEAVTEIGSPIVATLDMQSLATHTPSVAADCHQL